MRTGKKKKVQEKVAIKNIVNKRLTVAIILLYATVNETMLFPVDKFREIDYIHKTVVFKHQ